MIVAFLFNSDDTKYGGYYGGPIRTTILTSGVLQDSNRHLKVSVGDVLICSNSRTREDYVALAECTYFWHPYKSLLEDKLRMTYLSATVFAWVVQNITLEIAEKLHSVLLLDSAYLGMHGVDFSYPVHLALYRNSMVEMYRIQGRTCRLFYSMGEENGKDFGDFEEVKTLGFNDVDWEDRGARKTIFNDYDTVEHFVQVKDFTETVSQYLNGGTDESGELAMVLEDLDPKLFKSLGAAVRALKRAQNEEDIAQAGLSGRRYLEQLADAIFPTRETLHNDRKVTRDKYKNRIWAFIEDSLPSDDSERESKLELLGGEVDRLIDFFNDALHAKPDKDKVGNAYGDLAKLSASLLSLRPDSVRKPYYAYQRNILGFVKKVTTGHG